MIKIEALKHKDHKRRAYNYKRLKDAGFNSYEANRFKDFSSRKIIELINTRRDYTNKQNSIVGDNHA